MCKVVVAIAVIGAVLFVFPNYVHFYATYDPAAALRIDAKAVMLLDGIAWYIPPNAANKTMVVMAHGRSGNVAQLVPLAKHIAQAGHGVYMFEMPDRGLGTRSIGPRSAPCS